MPIDAFDGRCCRNLRRTDGAFALKHFDDAAVREKILVAQGVSVKRVMTGERKELLLLFFSRGHVTLHLAVSIGPLVCWSVRNIFKFRAVFLFYCSCSNRPRLDWSVFSVSLSVCQFVNLSVCQFCQSVSLSVCQSVNLSICQFVFLFSLLICQLFSLSTCYYASLLVCQFVSQVVYYAIVYLVFRRSVC